MDIDEPYGPNEIANDMAEPNVVDGDIITALIRLADDVSRWPWDPAGVSDAQAAADAVLELIPPELLAAVRSGQATA